MFPLQQFAKNAQGVAVSPKEAMSEANAIFKASPVSASLSGLWPRMGGVLLKRIPKFGFLLGYSYAVGEGEPGWHTQTLLLKDIHSHTRSRTHAHTPTHANAHTHTHMQTHTHT